MIKKEDIHIIINGGTIDSEKRIGERPKIKQKVVLLDIPPSLEVVEEVKNNLRDDYKNFPKITAEKYEIYEDSSDITHGHIKKIASDIVKSGGKNFIITHGTDSMIKNAELLNNEISTLKKNRGEDNDIVVLFTGAMTPLANGKISDGYANLRDSIKALVNNVLCEKGVNNSNGVIAPGVHICFDGMIMPPELIKKDFETGKFVLKKPMTKQIFRAALPTENLSKDLMQV